MSTLSEKKTRLKKLEILQRAAEVFQKKSFGNTTMEDIANQLMLTKGSLYYYFKSKEELLFYCHDYSLGIAIDLLKKIKASGESPLIKLRNLLAQFVHLHLSEPTALVVATELDYLKGEYRRKIFQKRQAFELGLREIIAEGVDQGYFHRFDPKIMGFIILGAINWITKWYSPNGPTPAEELVDVIPEVLIQGILKDRRRRDMSRKELEQLGSDLQKCLSSFEKLKSHLPSTDSFTK